MGSIILSFSFAAAIAIAACVTIFFSKSIDEALTRVIPAEMASAWNRYVKFALFVVTLAGGMRLSELTQFLAMRTPGGPPVPAGQALLEVFKSITGSLIAAAVALLGFFAATLVVRASMRIYDERRVKTEKTALEHERPAPVAERPPVGAVRHSGAKDGQRNDDAGRFL
jgi:hypothetical protein